jgi:transposase
MGPFSLDLRERIVAAVDRGELKQPAIAALFQVSVDFVRKLLKQRRRLGHVAALPHGGGRRRRLDQAAEETLKALVTQKPDLSLSELQELVPAADWKKGNKAPLGQSTLCRALQRAGLRRKKRASSPPKPTKRRARSSGR